VQTRIGKTVHLTDRSLPAYFNETNIQIETG
jgi:hypothetical protein